MNVLRFLPGEEIAGLDSPLLAAQHADEHLCLEDGSARCSLWWTVVPSLPGEKLGIVGHFQAASAESGSVLLASARDRLREQHCTQAVGPMDGNTWRRYRVLTKRGAEPPFFMEPDNPDWWQAAFLGAGFLPLAEYSSSLVSDLGRRDPRAARAWHRLESAGVTVRSLDPSRFEEDLRGIYEVSVESFTGNYLYTPLPEAAFLAQYLPYRDKIRPELVLLAEQDGRLAGYLFAIPDFAEVMRGEPLRTVVGKTLAVRPGRRLGGLGLVLVEKLHQRAQELGFERVIHALQHEQNGRVRKLSGFFGDVMRRYTLYSHRLA
jgi:GNAT superfamily N-acetyltransferase